MLVRLFSAFMLVFSLSACASQDQGDAIYNQIYKNGWTQTPQPMMGEPTFSDTTAAALL